MKIFKRIFITVCLSFIVFNIYGYNDLNNSTENEIVDYGHNDVKP